MKKRIVGILIVATMVICAIPVVSMAYDPGTSELIIGDAPITADGKYTHAEIATMKDDGGYVLVEDYGRDSMKITLNNVTIESSGAGIDVDDVSVDVVLNGNNKIKSTNNDGISADGSALIYIEGDGTLTIESESAAGIRNRSKNIVVDGVTLNIASESNAITAGNISFIGVAIVDAVANEDCIVASGETIVFDLSEGGKVHAKSKTGKAVYIQSYDEPTIELKNGKITTPTDGRIYDDQEDFRIVCIAAKDSTEAASEAVVENPVTQVKPAGANTGDSSDIALFSILGILALCGAGFVYKRREN